jgi:hypothetical protein
MFIQMLTQRLGGSIQDPLQLWEALNTIGLLPIRTRAWIFSKIVGLANPYARTIDFRITELRKGKACGVMKVKQKGEVAERKQGGGGQRGREDDDCHGKRKSKKTGNGLLFFA